MKMERGGTSCQCSVFSIIICVVDLPVAKSIILKYFRSHEVDAQRFTSQLSLVMVLPFDYPSQIDIYKCYVVKKLCPLGGSWGTTFVHVFVVDFLEVFGKFGRTRMHSSRIRTVHSSGRISGGGVPGSGGVYLVPGGVPGPGGGGCTWSQGGVPGPWGGAWSGTPPCGQTDACKNITFATSLRTVINACGSIWVGAPSDEPWIRHRVLCKVN